MLTPHQIGRQSEERVKTALAELLDEGMIRGYRKTRIYSKDDRGGIDFWIFTEGNRVPLQVKSSYLGKSNHEHYTYRSRVPCVIGRWTVDHLKAVLTQIVHTYKGNSYGHPAG